MSDFACRIYADKASKINIYLCSINRGIVWSSVGQLGINNKYDSGSKRNSWIGYVCLLLSFSTRVVPASSITVSPELVKP